MSEPLAGCPFCGSDRVKTPVSGEPYCDGRFYAECSGCHMHSGMTYETEAEAVAAWNRRVSTERESALAALEALTPGGSEFVGDPEACAAYVRRRLADGHEARKAVVKQGRALAALRDYAREQERQTAEMGRLVFAKHKDAWEACGRAYADMADRLNALTSEVAPGAVGRTDWVSVNKRLPGTAAPVIVWNADRGRWQMAQYTPAGWVTHPWLIADGRSESGAEITHWREGPSDPSAGGGRP